MSDIDINKDGVLKLLKKIKHQPGKASGPDMIRARILRDLAEDLVRILTIIFQMTSTLGEVPEDCQM